MPSFQYIIFWTTQNQVQNVMSDTFEHINTIRILFEVSFEKFSIALSSFDRVEGISNIGGEPFCLA